MRFSGTGWRTENFALSQEDEPPKLPTVHYKTLGLPRQTAQVSTEANPTHKMYGTRITAATRLSRQNETIVAAMSNKSTRTSINAKAPWCHAKNSQDHSALAASWPTNSRRARRVPSGLRQTSHTETPISAYSVDHTGPKTDAGGAHDGLFS